MKSGPFGLEMGTHKEELGLELEEVAPFVYMATIVPKPHSLFSRYVLKITPYQGLSWVKSLGKNIDTSVYGTEARSQFDSLLEKLKNAYGNPKFTDLLFPDSMWNEPRNWMQSLLNKERSLWALWDKENGAKLESNLKSIFLGITAVDTNTAFLYIEYSFLNEDAASAEIAALEDDAL